MSEKEVNPLEVPVSLNEEDAIRSELSRQHVHLKRRSLWRKTPNEIQAAFGIDAWEICRMAGR